MKNYIDPNTKEVYAYALDGSQDDFIKPGLVPISDVDLAVLRAPNLDDLKSSAITKVRALRSTVFSTLAGVQSQALSNVDTITAKAISTIQDQLKDLPDLDLSQCKTQADIDAAFEAGWAAIVSAAPANVVSAFNGVV